MGDGGAYGPALSFNGTNARVQVPSSASLNLSNAMTLEAWIQPSANQSGWRTILQKQTDAYFLNASNSTGPLLPVGWSDSRQQHDVHQRKQRQPSGHGRILR